MRRINPVRNIRCKSRKNKISNRVNFIKMVASGNDFVVAETRNPKLLARQICDRKYGVGADGLLILDKSKVANVKMRIFNPDGSEPAMCGNGARCIAVYSARDQKTETRNQIKIETKAGIIESEVDGNNVKIKFTEPKDLKLDLPIIINGITRHVSFVNTGVPHTVIFVSG
ncbi:MAG: diaminopimelate epimerase, partial [Candidatus Omnitrophica bacterium]|nr:diaminopimelate epimerase [Candidatus Omnitrophota bacterium]